MKAKVVYHDGYVKIEYQHGGTRTRKSTGVAIPNSSYLKANDELKSTVTDYKKKQKTINAYLSKAESILDEHLHTVKTYPTGEQFKRSWEEYDRRVKDSKRLLDYFDKFYQSKETEFSRKGFNKDSIKDYRNIRFYLEDFATETKREIYLDDVNRDWMNKFVLFLENERVDFDKPRKSGGKYWSKGKLNGKTVKKRIGLFIGFFNWMDGEKYFPFPKGLSNYFKTLDDSEAVKAILNREEVNRLYKHDFKDNRLNYIKDVFVLVCFTGMRWEDVRSFNAKDVHKQEGVGLMIEKIAKKTKNWYRVPLNAISQEIIKRHKFNFGVYDNVTFNKHLKLLLKQTGWFDDETKFKNEDGGYLKRWECVSVHRGRDSFCTMLVNNRVPLNEIMKYTGHKSVNSLNMYIDLKSEIKNFTNELVIT